MMGEVVKSIKNRVSVQNRYKNAGCLYRYRRSEGARMREAWAVRTRRVTELAGLGCSVQFCCPRLHNHAFLTSPPGRLVRMALVIR
jgi:hypothetical protein